MIKITSNGSKWAGESPDSIEVLKQRLKENTLSPFFEGYGNFVEPYGDITCISGNFLDISHVFDIKTDDENFIEEMTKLIRANQKTDKYREEKNRLTKIKKENIFKKYTDRIF